MERLKEQLRKEKIQIITNWQVEKTGFILNHVTFRYDEERVNVLNVIIQNFKTGGYILYLDNGGNSIIEDVNQIKNIITQSS